MGLRVLHHHLNSLDSLQSKLEKFSPLNQTISEKIVVVGYEPDGTPITQEELIQEVKEASAQVKAGNYITQEEMEKGVEGW